jgi:N-acetylglucosaminyldiphosphoundecaprenol N-acetyl-beta-D-mannosaminyltransferase
LSVFFFGGEGEASRLGCENLNESNQGITCAGYLNPGFGPIEAISSPEVIKQINQSRADFLIAALGAKKGQFWIDLNRSTLNTPAISHLGAVINFSAGSVRRAPRWMQRSGLEWIWRIAQEPNLWRRYWSDGMIFLRLLLTKVLPYALWNKINRKEYLGDQEPVEVKVETGPESSIISISGNCFHNTIEPLRAVFVEQAGDSKSVVVDLSAVPMIDGAFLGLCLMLCKQVNRGGGKLLFSGLNSKVTQIFRWNCAEFLL